MPGAYGAQNIRKNAQNVQNAQINRQGAPKNGFTLIELVAGLMLVGIILSVSTAFFLSGHQAAYQHRESTERHEQARYGWEFMLQEIRTAPQILSRQPESLTLVNHRGNKIVYLVRRETLYRDFYQRPNSSVMSTSHPLISNAETVAFYPCGRNGVRICLTFNQINGPYTLETVIYPRIE